KISIVRALQRSIFGRNSGAGFASINVQRAPRRPRSMASVNPTGPAPTIRTSVVIGGTHQQIEVALCRLALSGPLRRTQGSPLHVPIFEHSVIPVSSVVQ